MIQRLFKKVNGKIAFWEAEAKDGILIKRWSKCVKSGKVTEREKSFAGKGKQGRSDEEQAIFMLLSEVNSQVDGGYVFEESHCEWPVTNSLGFAIPMLAMDSKKVNRDIDYSDCSLTPKLDGHRMLIGLDACPGKVADPRYKADGQPTLYSRGSQKIDLPHIFDEIYPLARKHNLPLDGEVYHHGTPLQVIKSMVAKKSRHLSWFLYDQVSDEGQRARRFNIELVLPKKLKHVDLVPSHIVTAPEEALRYHKHYMDMGYEGTILRWGPEGYAEDSRPDTLVKQKDFADAEFEVVDMVYDEPRKDPKTGQLLLCPSFILLNNDGSKNTFKVTVHGNMYEKHFIGRQGVKHWGGKQMKVSFQSRSKAGIPTICTCLGERGDL